MVDEMKQKKRPKQCSCGHAYSSHWKGHAYSRYCKTCTGRYSKVSEDYACMNYRPRKPAKPRVVQYWPNGEPSNHLLPPAKRVRRVTK